MARGFLSEKQKRAVWRPIESNAGEGWNAEGSSSSVEFENPDLMDQEYQRGARSGERTTR
jgi:hypothetical protein